MFFPSMKLARRIRLTTGAFSCPDLSLSTPHVQLLKAIAICLGQTLLFLM